jgi:radical SAM superfamily enzyme YgiQ (UPF0313 family)
MGGIHASMMPDEALRHADAVVRGEAEGVWPELAADFLAGRMKRIYSSRLPELKGPPPARRELFDPRYLFATVQTSRGCPMDCEFCSVTAFNGRAFRQRPVEEVWNELELIPERNIFFVDDNIAGYSEASRRRAVKLFRGMAERKLDKVWFCQASLNFGTDNELLFWAHKAGCKMVFLGLESPDPDQLRVMNKKVNLRIDYTRALRNINRHKIAVLGAFINGAPEETPVSLKRKADYILRQPIDVIQATVMTPLPGTRLFDALAREGKLVYADFPADWDKYTMGELTFKLEHMERDQFMKLHHECNRRFYSRFSLVKRFFRTLVHTGSMECAIWAYNSNKNYRNVAFTYEA